MFEFAEPDTRDQSLALVRAQIRRYAEARIAPQGQAWEQAGEIPRAVFHELGGLGLLGMRHPVEYGGGGLGPLSSVILAEELSRSGFGGVASALTVHSDMSISHIAHRGAPEQKARYLPQACAGEKVGAICVTEPDAGSDVAGLKTRATRTDKGWILNGSKTFITNGVLADIYIVAARTDPQAPGARGVSLFIVERGVEGFAISGKLSKHGWRSSDTATLFFQDAFVPQDALLGEEGRGFYYIVSTFQNERLVIGGLVSGACAKAIDLTLDYLRQRKAFGKTLWEQPVVRNKLSWMAAKAAGVRALTYQCAQMVDEGQDVVREVSMLKALAGETLQEVVHTCLQLHGGVGYMVGTPIERMARDARILTIGGGATEVMLEEAAKRL